MQLKNWLGIYETFAARMNWVRRARRFVNRKARQGAPGYVTPGQTTGYGPSRWMSSPRMRRAMQRQDYFTALGQFERLEDRTLLTVVVESSAASFGTGGGSLTETVSSFEVPAGNDRAIVVLTSAVYVSTAVADFGSQSFTKVASSGTKAQVSIWIATLGSSGTATTADVTATFSGGDARNGIAVLALSGVDQTTPTSGLVTETSGDGSIDVVSTSGDLVVDAVLASLTSAGTVVTAGTGQTADLAEYVMSGLNVNAVGASHESGAATTTMSWDLDGISPAFLEHVGINIRQAVSSDSTPPTITSIARQSPATSTTNADSLTFRVTFNEDVQNVTAGDFTVTGPSGASIGVAAVSASVYDVTISGGDLGSLNATVDLNIAVGNDIQDLASNALGNTPTIGSEQMYVIDNTAPTVTISDDEAGTANIAGGDITYTFTFSEPVTGFTADDITVVNGTKGTFTPVSSTEYTLVVTPSPNFEGNLTVDVAGAVAIDAASNPNAVRAGGGHAASSRQQY
jgi:hypothetical protein